MSERNQLIEKHISAFEESGEKYDYNKVIQELKTALQCLNEKMDRVLEIAEKLENRSSLAKNFSNETH